MAFPNSVNQPVLFSQIYRLCGFTIIIIFGGHYRSPLSQHSVLLLLSMKTNIPSVVQFNKALKQY